ncbi:MAG: conjugative transposon protein TraK [Prevotellaceae bacterium]|nr:conjugative transposon protein TraK [Prevotellaceae bacterium]
MPVLKNLENKIKLTLIMSVVFITGSLVIAIGSLIVAGNMVNEAHKKIYVLDSNVPILVRRTEMSETLEVEAKADIEAFHQLFFTLPPDDKYIQYTMKKALYLVDATGLAQYNTLKEKGFFSQIVGTSTICSIFCDSIKFDRKTMDFTYYGRQRIERRTSILYRQLITAGKLRRMPRTDNNPYGFLITNWRTLVNKDLEEQPKSDY